MASPNKNEDEIETLFKTFEEKFAEVSQKISSLERDLQSVRSQQEPEN